MIHTYTTPATYSQIAEARLLRDLVLIDCEVDEVGPTATGDWPTIAGRANLHAAQRRRAVTSPGDLVHRGEYGGGMVLAVETSAAPHQLALSQRVRLNALRDPRVEEVQAAIQHDRTNEVVVLDLAVRPRGEPETDTVTVLSEV